MGSCSLFFGRIYYKYWRAFNDAKIIKGEKMKVKVRITRAKNSNPATSTNALEEHKNINEAYNVFAHKIRELNEYSKAWRHLLISEYRACFHQNIPQGINWYLIKTKIEYHLLVVEGYQKYKIPVPAKIQQNYIASQAFNIDGFDEGMKGLLTLTLKQTELTRKEDQMVKVKKAVEVIVAKKEGKTAPAKKAKKNSEPRVTVSGIFAEVFKANYSAKLTDENIAKLVNQKAKGLGKGHQYTMKEIPAVRRKFNLGMLAGQEGKKPAKELEKIG
jgi:hypothetical protein